MCDLKHSLSEDHLVLLSPALQDDVTEVREVDESVPGDGVAQVHDILLHGVQPQHFHSTQKVLNHLVKLNGYNLLSSPPRREGVNMKSNLC